MSPEPRLLTRPFLVLMVAHALQSLGFASLLLMPLYLDHLGASRTEVGLVLATSAIGGLLVRPLVGWALDRLGRISTLFVGTAFLATGLGLIGFVDAIGPLVYLVHAAVGIGTGSLFTGYFTMAADLLPPARRTEGLALFGIAGLVTLTVNPVADALGISGAGLRWFFVVMSGLVASSGLLLWWLPRVAPQPASQHRSAVFVALRRRALLPVWWATLVFSTLVAIFMAFATVTAQDRGMADPASVWLSYALGAVTVRLFGARLPERVGPSRMVVPSLLSYAVGVFGVAWAASGTGFLVAGLFAGLGHGFAFPVLTGQVVNRAQADLRGSAMALFTALWDLTKLMLVPVAGWLADVTDDATMLTSTGVLGVLSLGVWRGLERGALPHEDDESRGPGRAWAGQQLEDS
ncbi:MAG: MFS transporter [Myxococcota bacterium]